MLLLVAFTSCEVEKRVNPAVAVVQERFEPIVYQEFTPDSSHMQSTDELDVDAAFELDGFTIVSGFDHLSLTEENGFEVDTVNGWGDRLFLFNHKNEIIYKSKGVGDPYLYHPFFFRNDVNDKVIIICQLGFEYFFGGDAFLYENGKMTSIGNIDIDGPDMETSLIDIVHIQETQDETTFTFTGDTVCFNPAVDTEMISNNGLKYVYKNDSFKLVRSAR